MASYKRFIKRVPETQRLFMFKLQHYGWDITLKYPNYYNFVMHTFLPPFEDVDRVMILNDKECERLFYEIRRFEQKLRDKGGRERLEFWEV